MQLEEGESIVDKSLIISNLEMLTNYINKEIEDGDKSIEHWKERIEEFGEDTIAFPIENETYKQALDRAIENKEYFMKKFDENNKLIETLKEGYNG